jgi:hypothetical protein
VSSHPALGLWLEFSDGVGLSKPCPLPSCSSLASIQEALEQPNVHWGSFESIQIDVGMYSRSWLDGGDSPKLMVLIISCFFLRREIQLLRFSYGMLWP